MLLNEFFGKPIKLSQTESHHDDQYNDELFNYIIDHDRLHKDFFLPLAQKIKKDNDKGKLDKTTLIKEFMSMVNKGCMEFYQHKKMNGRLGKIFTKDVREDLCQRLYDHYINDIVNDKYTLS